MSSQDDAESGENEHPLAFSSEGPFNDEPPPYESVVFSRPSHSALADREEEGKTLLEESERDREEQRRDIWKTEDAREHINVREPREQVGGGEATDVVAGLSSRAGEGAFLAPKPTPSIVDDGHVRTSTYEPSFDIQVVDPVRQGEGVGAFISYKVVSKVQAEGYRPERHEVIRRYRDFTWLRNRLRSQYRGIIMPALPEKNALEKYKMTAEFVEQRRAALNVFINRVGSHKVLNRSADLRLFLQADETEFAIESSRLAMESGGPAPAGNSTAAIAARKTLAEAAKLFRNFSQTTHNFGVPQTASEQDAGGSGSEGGTNVAPSSFQGIENTDYLKTRSYMSGLEDMLFESYQCAERLSKQYYSLASALSDFGAAMGSLGRHKEFSANGSGAIMSDSVNGTGVASSSLGSNSTNLMAQLSAQASSASVVCRKTADELSRKFEAPMKEFARSIRSCKKAMADRDNALESRQSAREDVESRRARLTRLRSTPGIRGERVAQAERDLHAAQCQADILSEEYNKICQRMDADLLRFQRERVEDVGCVLNNFATLQDQSAMQLSELWSRLAVSDAPPYS